LSKTASFAAVLVLSLLGLPGQAGAQIDYDGILRGNDFAAQIDSVVWTTMGPPIRQSTPGWQVPVAGVDTFDFPTLATRPSGITLYHLIGPTPGSTVITGLRLDMWYTLRGGFGDQPDNPEVMFTTGAGCEELPSGIAIPGFVASPNPTRGPTRLALTAERDAPARVRIVSAAGRLVRTGAMSRAGAGVQTYDWDGRDLRGREVPDGVYFCAAVQDGAVQTARLVVQRD